jgi:hypothetical protein
LVTYLSIKMTVGVLDGTDTASECRCGLTAPVTRVACRCPRSNSRHFRTCFIKDIGSPDARYRSHGWGGRRNLVTYLRSRKKNDGGCVGLHRTILHEESSCDSRGACRVRSVLNGFLDANK